MIEHMSKDERSLLLYFETAMVDYGGKIDCQRMNDIDMAIAKEWDESGFIRFGRIAFKDIQKFGRTQFTHWCVLSDKAWEVAHAERRARAARIEAKLTVHRNGYD